MFVKATIQDLDMVQRIVYKTIRAIYPKYYPTEVVDFFLNHHSEDNILADLVKGNTFLLVEDGQYIGTGSIKGNEINRVFVLPEFQGRGFGSQIMTMLEGQIASQYNDIHLDSSLPAFNMYIRRGYQPIEYREELVCDKVLCYQVMRKVCSKISVSDINLNSRVFTSMTNTANGEVSGDTVFHYYQQGDVIWATYSGGMITRGFLIGKFIDSRRLSFSYQHINEDCEIRIGKCESLIQILPDGRLRLNEKWQWLDSDQSCGESVVEEKMIAGHR